MRVPSYRTPDPKDAYSEIAEELDTIESEINALYKEAHYKKLALSKLKERMVSGCSLARGDKVQLCLGHYREKYGEGPFYIWSFKVDSDGFLWVNLCEPLADGSMPKRPKNRRLGEGFDPSTLELAD